jgi:NAD(P)-dependent dehydrogenase (short-subunit alcohol dehydrogenase family)
MASAPFAPLLREHLLDGLRVVLAGAPSHERDLTGKLGARILELGGACATVEVRLDEDAESAEASAIADLAAAHRELGALDGIVIDGAALFSASPAEAALQLAPAAIWNGARAFANELIAAGRGGRIFILAPLPDGGEHAAAAVAGIENLARTLSIEWARYGIATVAIAPGAQTGQAVLTELMAYLLSPAGAYFSGCLLDLRGPAAVTATPIRPMPA